MSTDDGADQLPERYGEKAITRHGDDVIVASEGTAPLLVGRISDATQIAVLLHELTQLRTTVTDRGAQFGALLAPGVEYVFRPGDTDGICSEQTVATLPAPDGTVEADARPFTSAREVSLCFTRLYNLDLPSESLAVAERKQKFTTIVRTLHAQQTDSQMPDSSLAEPTANVFQGFDLVGTDREIKASFVDHATEIDGIQRYSTRGELAEFLVAIAGIETGDTVLDPAAGLGNITRAAASRGADVVGVDTDEEITTSARAFDSLLGLEVDRWTGDLRKTDSVVDEPDHVILEPPSTRNPTERRVGSLVTREGEHIEEEMLRQAANELPRGGTLTALIPFGMLIRPDDPAQQLRQHLRENYRIETLLELRNPAYYPYPGVRTAVIQLTAVADPGSSEVRVDRLLAGSDSGRFQAADGTPVETLLAEACEAIQNDTMETVPISTFSEILDPSDALRRRELERMLAEHHQSVARLEEVAETVTHGTAIPQRDLDTSGTPYLRIATRTGHETEQMYVADPEREGMTTATPSDLLVSVTGTVGMIFAPEDTVVPSEEWAIIRFPSAAAATTYASFFETTIGAELRDGLEASGVVPYPRYTPSLTIDRLREFPVPRFDPETQEHIAAAINEADDPPAGKDLDALFEPI